MNEQTNEALFNFSIENEAVGQNLQNQLPKETELNVPKIDDEPESLRGTLIDFLDHIQGGFQSPAEPIKSSSSIEEIQEQQAQLKYRRAWLQAILNETDRELGIIAQIIDSEQ
ncbi:MAG: hypothetical protein KME01_10930 [Chroococcus sp. CMT-3BRIN-NPC107]|jgi:hypothetical protein|nr:hypothetical protein [Chroococcus sp. CMT-3BRIN-NPC107]